MSANPAATEQATLNMLIVDDEPAMRSLLKQALESAGKAAPMKASCKRRRMNAKAKAQNPDKLERTVVPANIPPPRRSSSETPAPETAAPTWNHA